MVPVSMIFLKKNYQKKCRFLSAVVLLALAGCTTTQHVEKVDDQVYTILKSIEKDVFGQKSNTDFSLSDRSASDIVNIEDINAADIRAASEIQGEVTLTLQEVLDYAIKSSHEYQRERESLYLTALSLNTRQDTYRISAASGVSGELSNSSTDEESGNLEVENSLSKALKAGTSLSLVLANDLLKYFTGNSTYSASSVLSFNLSQPLLRGRGSEIVAENLTQSYRNVIYALRDYSNFQVTFANDIVISYLRLLQQQEEIQNEYNNYLSRKRNTEYLRERSVDREKPQDVRQSEQNELLAKNRYINAQSSYETSLDNFKIRIGMPSKTKLTLTFDDLEKIEKSGVLEVKDDQKKAYSKALKYRLPMINKIDAFEDAKRKVKVAANALKTDLNFLASFSLGNTGNQDFERLNFKNLSSSIGLELDLPINRRSERATYRQALISLDVEARGLSREYDELINLINLRYRQLSQFKQNYDIQQGALVLAKTRVEGDELALKAGTLIFSRLSESQDSLIEAQNAVTQALLNYLDARLNLYEDMGTLDVFMDEYWLKANPEKTIK